MAGVVGGAVGEGAYAGKVLDMVAGPTTTVEAIYGFGGSERALHRAGPRRADGPTTPPITGVVTDGWGKGSPVKGRNTTEIQCEHDGIDDGLLARDARQRRVTREH